MSTETILAPLAALTLPDSSKLTQRAQSALQFIETFEIDSAETYGLAAEELRAIKARANALEEQRTGITGPMNTALKAINALFKGPSEVLAQGETILKRKMLAWQTEQERLAAEARRKAEEFAAAERRKAEEEAAAAQREAQAQAESAATAQRAQEAAAAAAAQAAAAGDAEAAAKALREAEAQAQAQALAQAASQRAQAEAQTAAVTAQVIVAPVLAVAPPKAAGVSTSTKLDFEVTDLLALVKHIADKQPDLIGLVIADNVRLRAYVKGVGTACTLPGVRVFESKVLSSRAA